ncbi:MAG: hypothetical protein K8H88_24070, partial [Sandaracinaceae bacterium]|nr:hypothetical protein [Sandaracinaceae bacterium]
MWVALRWRMATPAGGTPTLHVEALVASNLWAVAADEAQRAEREPMRPGDGTRITGVVRCPTRGIALGGGGRSCPVVV